MSRDRSQGKGRGGTVALCAALFHPTPLHGAISFSGSLLAGWDTRTLTISASTKVAAAMHPQDLRYADLQSAVTDLVGRGVAIALYDLSGDPSSPDLNATQAWTWLA